MIPEHNRTAKKANTSPGELSHTQCPGQEGNHSVRIRAHLEYKAQEEEMSPLGMAEEIGHGISVRREARAESDLPMRTAKADIRPRKHLILCDFKDQGLDTQWEAAEENDEVSIALTSPSCEHRCPKGLMVVLCTPSTLPKQRND